LYDESQVTRWFDGLINKDIQITNEVYSIQGVEFDRQVIFCTMNDQVAADLCLLTFSEHINYS
jgi:hypothetical protein